MNEQAFINAYIKLLNDSFNEAINKNIVLQAQLEVAKKDVGRVAELEEKVKQLSTESFDNSGLAGRLQELERQLAESRNQSKSVVENLNSQLANKAMQAETFKREVLSCRETIKNLTNEIQVLKSRKKKKPVNETVTENVVEHAAEAKIEDSSSDTF
jgi:erythromycin esterase-like protein